MPAFVYPYYLLSRATFSLRPVIQFPLGPFFNSFIRLCFDLPSGPLRFHFTTAFIIHSISIRDQPVQFFYIAVLLLYRALCTVVLNPYYIFFTVVPHSTRILHSPWDSFFEDCYFFFISSRCRPCPSRRLV